MENHMIAKKIPWYETINGVNCLLKNVNSLN